MKKSGFVSIVGRPNVGKSTLMNHIIKQKISITSNKPQTTRHAITGIYTDDSTQIVFLDTPGIHTNLQSALNRQLNRTAMSSLTMANAVIFMVEAMRFNDDDNKVLQKLKDLEIPIILLINKVDNIENKEALLPFLQEMMAKHDFAEIVPISANQDRSCDLVVSTLEKYLPEQEFMYGEDEITTVTSSFLASEVLREKLTRRLNQELPYAITVEVESFKIEGNLYRIHAVIWVEKESQKGIVIGKQGRALRDASTQAREALEKLFDAKVFLKAHVKVREGWSNDADALHSLGYKELQ
ncbi:GTPase Era [Ignatzschineria sp. RMDPL8A]|uniref:GTPase Era n=1 Tax=Ignatzschineria sp. RMDPL8A TaxID=2999236 RepID=UPI00169E2AA8|nr:GTPase Era [Ignatzschineria sp. RMDPL8A]MDG9729639.1 GTPase Era [Ignatzschineria sp. RMDPL8A]NLD08243.1 GTPase Era [Xanthomonadaceae bacterium]